MFTALICSLRMNANNTENEILETCLRNLRKYLPLPFRIVMEEPEKKPDASVGEIKGKIISRSDATVLSEFKGDDSNG